MLTKMYAPYRRKTKLICLNQRHDRGAPPLPFPPCRRAVCGGVAKETLSHAVLYCNNRKIWNSPLVGGEGALAVEKKVGACRGACAAEGGLVRVVLAAPARRKLEMMVWVTLELVRLSMLYEERSFRVPLCVSIRGDGIHLMYDLGPMQVFFTGNIS